MEEQIWTSHYNFIPEVKRELPEEILVYDSTLRDGEQMPGVSFTMEQKLSIARALDEARVPQIEVGFPCVSTEEAKIVKKVVREGLDADILVLSRLKKDDIDLAIDCGVDMVLLFIASSDLHICHKLHHTKEELPGCVTNIVEYSRDHGMKAAFSTEDTTRTELDYLKKLYGAAEQAGACRLGITDTVGCISPYAMAHLVDKVRDFSTLPVSVHCHNDFGLAVANAIAGVAHGASAVATTVNGIGERAGNASLAEFVVALKALFGRDLGIKTERLEPLARMVADFSKIPFSPNRPLVGENAFSHESGIHVAAVLKEPATYEPIPPEMVGNTRKLVLGKHSGKAAILQRLGEREVQASQEEVEKILRRVKFVGGVHGLVDDDEFWAIVEKVVEG